MAERSKAPDSSVILMIQMDWVFWSPNGGVGSNPTSDTFFVDCSVYHDGIGWALEVITLLYRILSVFYLFHFVLLVRKVNIRT